VGVLGGSSKERGYPRDTLVWGSRARHSPQAFPGGWLQWVSQHDVARVRMDPRARAAAALALPAPSTAWHPWHGTAPHIPLPQPCAPRHGPFPGPRVLPGPGLPPPRVLPTLAAHPRGWGQHGDLGGSAEGPPGQGPLWGESPTPMGQGGPCSPPQASPLLPLPRPPGRLRPYVLINSTGSFILPPLPRGPSGHGRADLG